MPRKPFERQARWYFRNRGMNHTVSQGVKICKQGADEHCRYDECWWDFGIIIRNPSMKPLLHKGGKP